MPREKNKLYCLLIGFEIVHLILYIAREGGFKMNENGGNILSAL